MVVVPVTADSVAFPQLRYLFCSGAFMVFNQACLSTIKSLANWLSGKIPNLKLPEGLAPDPEACRVCTLARHMPPAAYIEVPHSGVRARLGPRRTLS